MDAVYTIVSFKSGEDFQNYLNSLAEGWTLHSWSPGAVQWAVAVFVHSTQTPDRGKQA